MNKDSVRDIEQYLSTGGLMDVLEISALLFTGLWARACLTSWSGAFIGSR
jgi:hypothetical protein